MNKIFDLFFDSQKKFMAPIVFLATRQDINPFHATTFGFQMF